MNLIIWVAFGGLIGWLASRRMGSDGRQGVLLSVVVGVMGALLGGWFVSPLVGGGAIDYAAFNLPSLLVSLVGAIFLLAIVNLLARGSMR